jgi:hypothetical protein
MTDSELADLNLARYTVGRSTSVSYGPGYPTHDGWELRFSTEDGERVVVELDREAMYELWIEVKNTPWPRSGEEYQEHDDLLGELVERANGASTEQLRDALDAFGGDGRA